MFDRDVLALDVPSFRQATAELSYAERCVSERCTSQKPDDRHRRLLRARRERPRYRRAAEQRDELAPLHSITSSARARTLSGTVRPSALATLRLITNSNF